MTKALRITKTKMKTEYFLKLYINKYIIVLCKACWEQKSNGQVSNGPRTFISYNNKKKILLMVII